MESREDTPIPDRMHITGARTNIRRTMTPYGEGGRGRGGEGERGRGGQGGRGRGDRWREALAYYVCNRLYY